MKASTTIDKNLPTLATPGKKPGAVRARNVLFGAARTDMWTVFETFGVKKGYASIAVLRHVFNR
jgi:hypothetical protein